MSNLTKELKAGNLEEGFYYLKMASGNIVIDQYYNNGKELLFANYLPQNIKEVIAPVPSLVELQNYSVKFKLNLMVIGSYERKIKKFRELLKECSEYLCFRYSRKKTMKLLTKINEVLK